MNMTTIRKTSQLGMVSIMVTMLMMIVISLIVLGFAQVSRREQTEALDRQLSTQAFFAAESGVNDARSVIKQKLADGQPIPEKDTCDTTTTTTNYPFDPSIDPNNKVSYTCLLVTTKLNNVTGTIAANGDPIVLPIEPSSGSLSSFRVNWTPESPTTTAAITGGCTSVAGTFKTSGVAGAWNCPFGVLRLDIVPTDVLARANLMAGQHTMFLYPTSANGVGTQDYATSNGAVPTMNCTAAAGCNILINNVTGNGKFAIKASAIYKGGTFTIAAQDGGPDLELMNAQVSIDVTGRARDVLRRIQVRLPLTNATGIADTALTSGSAICKHFQYGSGTFSIPSDIKLPQDDNNPTCKAMTAP
jgi:hypothetical protein